MSDKEFVIPRSGETNIPRDHELEEQVAEQPSAAANPEDSKKAITQDEADIREKVFFEEDEKIRLRDGKTYYIPPLGLKDARKLMKKLNTIDNGVIIANLIPEGSEDEDRFEELMEVLLMAFKPYYKDMTTEHLENYVDLESAKKIIDCMIGLNGLKKSL
ncbi:DNA polymerase III subunit gamma/tau [Paenibacillus sp. HJL G12]|uniref:DNA polymerase III subunit gamma/tau n=1 Tax=Paenibacillus dendrobii TaxID=2691084 RepID=A0A7X3LGE0_9BACL|nr:DNA polymerase III subunit gamma/tau [Paenibacillus dendrobii]MWV43100.1 DNA polymerase III subunit gamma/tau [Paenibacillus dendrobii]